MAAIKGHKRGGFSVKKEKMIACVHVDTTLKSLFKISFGKNQNS